MGGEGWDAGSWPYIIFAVARTRDGNGELFGYNGRPVSFRSRLHGMFEVACTHTLVL